jgi:hypothetical protein
MDDERVARAILRVLEAAKRLLRRVNWIRLAIGLVIYYAMMHCGYIIMLPIAAHLAMTGQDYSSVVLYIVIVYAIVAICCAIWGSGRLTRKLKNKFSTT